MNTIDDFTKEELYDISLYLIKEIYMDYLVNIGSGFAGWHTIIDERGLCDYCGSLDCGDGDIIKSHLEKYFKEDKLWQRLKDY